jgi:hypothetical protein
MEALEGFIKIRDVISSLPEILGGADPETIRVLDIGGTSMVIFQ